MAGGIAGREKKSRRRRKKSLTRKQSRKPKARMASEVETESETKSEMQTCKDPARDCLGMLKQATADGVFDPKEETALRDLLYRVPEGSDETSPERNQKDGEWYGLFFSHIELTYWYFYEQAGADKKDTDIETQRRMAGRIFPAAGIFAFAPAAVFLLLRRKKANRLYRPDML